MQATKRRYISQSTQIERTKLPKYTLQKPNRREKLKTKLVEKYKSTFGPASDSTIIETEVSKFLKKDNLNDNDLKQLEESIRTKLSQKTEQDTLKENLTCPNNLQKSTAAKNQDTIDPKVSVTLPNINNCDTRSAKSGMSGASDLDKFNERCTGNEINEQEIRDFQKIKSEGLFKKLPPKRPQIDYSKYNDEWDAINMYNKKLFEDEIRINRIKDEEIQRRTRFELQNQMKAKMLREYEEKLKEQEYQQIMMKHVKRLNELDEQKRIEKEKMAQLEREARDKQRKEAYVRHRIEFLKRKKYERELVKSLQEENLRLKKMEIEKKTAENAALKQTLKENELRKQKMIEKMKQEQEDDFKIAEDAKKIREKQDNERKEYSNRIIRNSNNFDEKSFERILKEKERKDKEEDEKIIQYLKFKNQQQEMEERRKEQKMEENKRMIKQTLIKQMEEKKKMREYEEEIDKAQGRLLKKDAECYRAHQREVEKLIGQMRRNHLEYLKFQIEENKKKNNNAMNQTELAMNRDLLEKAAEMK